MMAKRTKSNAKSAKPEPPAAITVTYDLSDLPTAQHKAGLAGLLLQIESMKNRKKIAPVYRWDDAQPNTRVHVEFTAETTQALFDDLYAAALIEGPPREKPFTKGKGSAKHEVPPARRVLFSITDKKGKQKVVEGYVYLELTPSLATLRHYLPEQGEWVRLWRDLIWQIIREGRKKAPYIKRAAKLAARGGVAIDDDSDHESDPDDEAESGTGDGSSWSDLLKFASGVRDGSFSTGQLSGAMLLGAMAKNAEILPLEGRLEQNLLLHFWPLTSLVFVPRFIDRDGNEYIGRRDKDNRDPHFAIAVPEVSDLRSFVSDLPLALKNLNTEIAVFRPRESVIDLAAEGGVSYIEHLARLVTDHASSGETRSSVNAIEYFHVTKTGNNVKFLSSGRIAPRPHLAEDYRSIVGRPGEKRPYQNPFFRRALIIALLENQSWFQPFSRLFADWPHRFFVPSDDPPKLSWFWLDARKKLYESSKAMPNDATLTDPPPETDDVLADTVNRLIRRYLDERLKPRFDFVKYRKAKHTPQDAAEARRKLGERLFLEFRSRRDQAFVSHFSGTFFSVSQYLGNRPVNRLFDIVADALMHRTDEVKTLTLMALSANSWVFSIKKEHTK
jgi:CRISPR-associated protein Cmx8